MTCKGICIHHKALSRYSTGNKRCKNCDLFIRWEGLYCPCCGYKLRTRPRNFSMTKLREKKTISDAKQTRILYHA
jgi:predicted amidophosphoribosyltransferase